jgi:hypothetical protein
MPSIVIKSSAFSASGLALNSQQFTEDISGLVRVAMKFTTTTSRRDAVSQLFYVDAPPPIWPSSIDGYLLQSEQLYMVDRTVTQSNGLVEFSTQYAGALKSSIANPRVSLERESKNFQLQIRVAQMVTQTYWRKRYDYWYLDPNTASSFNSTTGTSSFTSSIGDVYDTYSGNATIGVKRISFACVGDDTFSPTPPSVSSLILGATSTTKNILDLSYQWNPSPTGGQDPFPAGSGYGEGSSGPSGQIIGGPYYERSRSAASLLGEFGGYQIASDSGIDFITPTVFVKTARFWLEQ